MPNTRTPIQVRDTAPLHCISGGLYHEHLDGACRKPARYALTGNDAHGDLYVTYYCSPEHGGTGPNGPARRLTDEQLAEARARRERGETHYTI